MPGHGGRGWLKENFAADGKLCCTSGVERAAAQ
jgi:hypothetical protein